MIQYDITGIYPQQQKLHPPRSITAVISVNAMSDSSLYSPCPKTATEAP